jgi:hypothetical protein
MERYLCDTCLYAKNCQFIAKHREGAIGCSAYINTFGVSIDRLSEICEAERDGRLVLLPCKVGDYLWVNSRYCNRNVPPEKVPCSIYPNCKGCPFKMIEPTPIKVCSMETLGGFLDRNEIGKVLHLTRAEAEAALKEAQHE